MLAAFQDFENAGIVGNVQRLADQANYDHMGVVFSPEGNPGILVKAFAIAPLKDR